MAEKTYLLRMTEKEHKKLMELSKESRQSVSQFVLSKTIDEDSRASNIEQEIKILRQKLENRDLVPTNAKTGI